MKKMREKRYINGLKRKQDKMESIYDELEKTKAVAIYGAGVIAYNIASALYAVYGIKIICYFVSDLSNTHFFGGIQAELYSEEKFYQYKKPLIVVATPEEYHEEIVKCLSYGSEKKYYLVDASIEYEIMRKFYRQRKSFLTVEDLPKDTMLENKVDSRSFEVYMARSIWDKPLKKSYEIPNWTIPVHAGKKLTQQKLSNDTDDFVGGISERNKNYCELTVTYWAWKMRHASYMGICHYRRIFVLSACDIDKIIENDVDVILPVPFLCSPDASEQYFRYITKEDYAVFMKIISKFYRETEIVQILHSKYFYNYNMLIAKEEIFHQYCEFLFPVLFGMESYFKRHGIRREDRYLGYFGELLTTIFFSLHHKDFKIVHAKKQWLV